MRLPSVFRGLPRTYWVLWIGTLVDRLGGFAFAFLTLYLTSERNLRVDEASAILSLGGLGGLVGSLAGGVLADHLGRKRTLVVSMAIGALVMIALAFVREPWIIAGLWLLYGLGGSAARPASSALVADIVPTADRLRAFALLHWAVNIGFAIAPAIGGFLARRTYTGLFLADGATTLLTVALIAIKVPGDQAPAPTEPAWRGMTRVFRDPAYVGFLAFMVVVASIYSQAESSMPVDMVAKGMTTQTYGLVIAVNGLLITFFSPVVAGALGRAEPPRILAAAALCTAVGFGLNALVATGPLYAVAVAVWTFGEIAMNPASGALVAALAPPDQRGRYSGAYAMSWNLARFAGPPAGGLIIAHFGAPSLWLACLIVGVAAAAGILCLSPALTRRLARQRSG